MYLANASNGDWAGLNITSHPIPPTPPPKLISALKDQHPMIFSPGKELTCQFQSLVKASNGMVKIVMDQTRIEPSQVLYQLAPVIKHVWPSLTIVCQKLLLLSLFDAFQLK